MSGLRIGTSESITWGIVSITLCAPKIDPEPGSDGIVTVRSAYALGETFFTAMDQSELPAKAGIKLHSSTPLVFGNPTLGVQFITSNSVAGLDWHVRLLVFQDENGRCGLRIRTSHG